MSKYTLGGDPPQSRAEKILMGEEVIPQSRLEELLLEKNVDPQSRIEDLLNEDHDPGSVVLIDKTIMENGTYNAASDNADGYKRVAVNVPNSYTTSDIGKVVDSALVLVDQSYAPLTIMENGEQNTTYIKRVIVNVNPSLKYSANDVLLSNPFSELDFSVLYSNLHNGIYSGFLWCKFNGMMVQVELYARNNIIGGMAFKTDPAVVGVECEWGANGVVTLNALMNGQVQDMRAYAPQLAAHVYLYGTTAPTSAT